MAEQIAEIDDLRAALMADEPDAPKRRGRPPKAREDAPAPVTKSGATLEIVIARDWWDEDAVRHRAGSVVAVDASMALALVEDGIARVKR